MIKLKSLYNEIKIVSNRFPVKGEEYEVNFIGNNFPESLRWSPGWVYVGYELPNETTKLLHPETKYVLIFQGKLGTHFPVEWDGNEKIWRKPLTEIKIIGKVTPEMIKAYQKNFIKPNWESSSRIFKDEWFDIIGKYGYTHGNLYDWCKENLSEQELSLLYKDLINFKNKWSPKFFS